MWFSACKVNHKNQEMQIFHSKLCLILQNQTHYHRISEIIHHFISTSESWLLFFSRAIPIYMVGVRPVSFLKTALK